MHIPDRIEDHEISRIADTFLWQTRSAISCMSVPAKISAAVRVVLGSKKIVTTGLGKAGHAARKASSSFCSLGFSSCYLNPAEASHGDVGVISEGDCLIVFSTSGKTREILETIVLARCLNVSKVIAITSHPSSDIRDVSDVVLDMGVVEEAGFMGLAPTTSIIVMLIIADMLALTCAELAGVTREDFGLRHHGGYLGRKCRGEEK